MSRRPPRPAHGETFLSLQSRNFRLFFAGQGISQIGNWLTMVAQALLVYKLTHNGFYLGLLTAFQFLPVLFIAAWAGVLADRSDKRKLLIKVQIVAMAQSFGLAALALMGRPPIVAIFALATVSGVTTAFDNPARRAFVTEMVPEEHVQNAVSINTALMTSSRIFGPALAGLLVVTVGYSWTFALDAFSYLAVIYGLWRMNVAELRTPKRQPRSKGQIRSGFRYARGTHELWTPLVMMAIVGTMAFNFSVTFPVLVNKTFGHPVNTYTIVMSVMSIGSVAAALITARRKTLTVHSLVLSSLGFGVSMLLLAFVPWFAGVFPLSILVGLTSITFMTVSTTIVQIRSVDEMRGRVLALQAIVFLGSTPIGGPIVGAISQYFGGPRAGIAAGGIACLVAAVWGELRDRSWHAKHDFATAAPLQTAAA
jgi:MFS family permease